MLPPAIIFINGDIDGYGYNYGDLNTISKLTLESQLYIQETITGDEFDTRIIIDPNYPAIIHSMNYRILVIKGDVNNHANNEYADIILFVKQGLVSVIKNNYGSPGLTVPLSKIEIHQLLRYNKSKYVVNLPLTSIYPFPRTLGGIFAMQSKDISGVHEANSDNEYNNEEFINRK